MNRIAISPIGRRGRAALSALALAAAAWTSTPPAYPQAPSAPRLPAGEISKPLEAIRDLRVYLDFDDDPATFASWPLDKSGRRLPAHQIARAVRLGLAMWASVLPDMRFRFAVNPDSANLGIRFAEYRHSGILPEGGRAFLPGQWGELDMDCGRLAENRMPDGTPCGEWDNNIIIMHSSRWAVDAIDHLGNAVVYADFAWIFDPARPHYIRTGESAESCGDGFRPGTFWSHTCVPLPRSPFYDSLAGYDLAAVIQHEFGHTLIGHHTPAPYKCVDYGRRPILSRDSCVRLVDGEFSSLFPGDAVDGWWNRRGMFGIDAGRLKGMGYAVSYPGSRAAITLSAPGGRTLVTSDWKAAHRAMIWPLQSAPLTAAQARRQMFVVDVRPLPGRAGN